MEAKELRRIVRALGLPIRRLDFLDLAGKGAGTVTEDDDGAAWVQPFDDGSLAGLDFAFLFDADAEVRALADSPANRDTRMLVVTGDRSGLPLTMTGIRDLASGSDPAPRRAALPTSTTLFLARLHDALRQAAPLRDLTATVLEPASIAGDGALEEMLGQAIGLLNCHPLPKNVFGRQRIFNVFPRLDPAEIEKELAELHGAPPPIHLARLDGCSFHGHAISLFARFDGTPTAAEVEAALGRIEGAEFERSEFLPGPIESAGSDEVRFAPVEVDGVDRSLFRIWMVADHLRVGPPREAARIAASWLASEPVPPDGAAKRARRP
jgi:hypothetical protein